MSKLDNINISPLFDIIIPSTKQKCKFRAYNVKEERALLAADHSEDGVVMLNTLLQVVKNCLTPVPEKLTSFDLEYLFAQIRARSVGEVAVLRVGCDEVGCEEVSMEYRYDLRDIKVVFPPEANDVIKLSDTLAVKMSFPSVEDSITIEQTPDENDKKYLAIRTSIQYIYNDDEVIDVKEESPESISRFVDRLLPDQYAKLEKFFDYFPTTEGQLKYRCPNCRKEHVRTIKGLASFFS